MTTEAPGNEFQASGEAIDLRELDWLVVNDVVMGGRSSAVYGHSPSGLEFRGSLSTDNGGGFSSIRADYDRGFGDWKAFVLTVTGDGREYQFRLRENVNPDAVAWRARFRTNSRRQSVLLPREDFEAVIRGRRVETLPGITGRDLRYLGFMLTSDQPGPFSLTVHRLGCIPSAGVQ